MTDSQPKGTQKAVEGATDPDAMYPVILRGRRPFDRQEGEPGRCFQIFLTYLSLPERTPEKLREHWPILTTKQVMQLADRFSWRDRAESWDRWWSSAMQTNLTKAEEGKAIDISKTVRALALTASLAATRTLEVLKGEKRNRVKRDSHGNPVLKDGKIVYEKNPHYIPAQRTTIELVKASTELVRLLAGQPGSVDEAERRKQADDLLKKLDAMAQSLVPKPQASVLVSNDGDHSEQAHVN